MAVTAVAEGVNNDELIVVEHVPAVAVIWLWLWVCKCAEHFAGSHVHCIAEFWCLRVTGVYALLRAFFLSFFPEDDV